MMSPMPAEILEQLGEDVARALDLLEKLVPRPRNLRVRLKLIPALCGAILDRVKIARLAGDGVSYLALRGHSDNSSADGMATSSGPRGGMEEDFDTEVIKRKVVEGFFVGHGEWRGTWSTAGA